MRWAELQNDYITQQDMLVIDGFIGPDPTSIVAVEFDYVLANDYKVEVWSDHQPGIAGLPRPPLTSAIIDAQRPALLPVVRAEGNVQDVTNIRRVSFDYGLPTATHIMGATFEVVDFHGFNVYGEADLNWNFRKYPNRFTERHRTSSGLTGEPYRSAWFVNAWRRKGAARRRAGGGRPSTSCAR